MAAPSWGEERKDEEGGGGYARMNIDGNTLHVK